MTLGRTIWFLVKLGIVVAIALWLAYNPGRVRFDWWGYRADMAMGVLAALLALALMILYAIWRFWHALRRAPSEFRIGRTNRKRQKGLDALTRGLVAVAAGNASEAKRQALNAHRLLGAPEGGQPLALLLAAQAAQLEGDEPAAERYFKALLTRPGAELLGQRGLATAALKRGDEAVALGHAESALASQPRAQWAAETAHRLNIKHGHPERALAGLKSMIDSGLLPAAGEKRRRAVLLAEQARLILASGQSLDYVRRAARDALKLDGNFVAARLLLSEALIRDGKGKQAQKLIEQIWDDAPHALLGAAFLRAEPGLTATDKLKRLDRLKRQNPNDPETHRVMGFTALAAGDRQVARKHLDRLAETEALDGGVAPATARALAALTSDSDIDVAREWLEKAADARPDAAYICHTCGHPAEAGPPAGNWQACCPHCDAIDSYDWRRPDVPASDPIDLPALPSFAALAQAASAEQPSLERALQMLAPANESGRESALSQMPLTTVPLTSAPVATMTAIAPAARTAPVPDAPTDSVPPPPDIAGTATAAADRLAPSVDAARLIN